MKKVTGIFIFVLLFFSNISYGYTDLNENYWANKDINELSNKEIVNGYPDMSFKPENKITRAEFITILAKVIEPKADVHSAAGYWADNSIKILKDKNILKLEEYSHFEPDKNITRREICKMIYRSLEGIENINIDRLDKKKNFIDLNKNNIEEYKVISILSHLNILNGYPDGTIKLNNTSSRAEICCFINNLIKSKVDIITMINDSKVIVYEDDVAVVNINELPNTLKKWKYANDTEYITTKINKIELFEFNKPLEKYKDIFNKFNNTDNLYLKYRGKFGKDKYVLAIEFDTTNNTNELETYCGHEFLHITFPEQEINIIDAFDISEINRQLKENANSGEVILPCQTKSTSAFYVLNTLPKKIRIDRNITSAYDIQKGLQKIESFHSLIVNLESR